MAIPRNQNEAQPGTLGPLANDQGANDSNKSYGQQAAENASEGFALPNTNAAQSPVQPFAPAPAAPSAPKPTPSPAPAPTTAPLPDADTGKKEETVDRFANNTQEQYEEGVRIQQELAQQQQERESAPATSETTTKQQPDGSTTSETKTYETPEAREFDESMREYSSALDGEYEYVRGKFNDIATGADEAQSSLIRSINASFDVRTKQQKKINSKQLQTTTAIGNRQGRSRYAPDLQSSILTNEESEGIDRLAELDVKRLQLIAQAQAAATDEDLSIVRARSQDLSNLRQEQYAITQSLYNLSVKEEERGRKRQEFGFKSEMETQAAIIQKIQTFAGEESQFSEDDIKLFANKLGVSKDVTKQYIATQEKVNKAKSESEQIESLTSLFDMLEMAPSDKTFMFDIEGEQLEYSGMNYGDLKTFKEFNKATNKTSFITIDEQGKIVNTESVGGFGTGYQTSRTLTTKGVTPGMSGVMTFEEFVAWTESIASSTAPKSVFKNGQVEDSKYIQQLRTEYNFHLKNSLDAESLLKYEKNQFKRAKVSPLTDVQRNTALANFMAITELGADEFFQLRAEDKALLSRASKAEVKEASGGNNVKSLINFRSSSTDAVDDTGGENVSNLDAEYEASGGTL